MVLALQSYNGFIRFSSESAVATVVALSITRELGPVLAGLMVTGRVGSSIAAELGSMKVSDQVDALRILGTNPFEYLIAPRIIACIICLPALVIIGDIIGVFGGFLVGVYKLISIQLPTYTKQYHILSLWISRRGLSKLLFLVCFWVLWDVFTDTIVVEELKEWV